VPGAPFFTPTTVGTPRSWIQFFEARDCKPPYLLSLLAPLPIPRMDGSSKRIAASLRACIKHVRRNPAHTCTLDAKQVGSPHVTPLLGTSLLPKAPTPALDPPPTRARRSHRPLWALWPLRAPRTCKEGGNTRVSKNSLREFAGIEKGKSVAIRLLFPAWKGESQGMAVREEVLSRPRAGESEEKPSVGPTVDRGGLAACSLITHFPLGSLRALGPGRACCAEGGGTKARPFSAKNRGVRAKVGSSRANPRLRNPTPKPHHVMMC
jgi:hypothetical protein